MTCRSNSFKLICFASYACLYKRNKKVLYGDQQNRPLAVPNLNENLNDLRPCWRILQFKILGTIIFTVAPCILETIYRVRHKSVNTPLSHERLVGGLQDGGRGTHVTHFVQLYPQPLYNASQVRTKCRSWDEGMLTDLCLTLYCLFME